jgi:hypothetical protein
MHPLAALLLFGCIAFGDEVSVLLDASWIAGNGNTLDALEHEFAELTGRLEKAPRKDGPTVSVKGIPERSETTPNIGLFKCVSNIYQA